MFQHCPAYPCRCSRCASPSLVRIEATYSNAHRCWVATVYTSKARIVQATARGRDKGAAIADAVARFRTTRSLRHAA